MGTKTLLATWRHVPRQNQMREDGILADAPAAQNCPHGDETAAQQGEGSGFGNRYRRRIHEGTSVELRILRNGRRLASGTATRIVEQDA